jgi:FkbM family methyltransferase
MTVPPGGLAQVTVAANTYVYNDPHDVLGIIETVVFDVYRTRLIRSGSTVIDLGAGIGDFAVMASRAVGPAGTVVAIEPRPEDFEYLLRNLKLNRCRNVVPINAAVSDVEKDVTLSFKGRTTSCKARRLRDLLRGVGVDAQSIRYAKIDIEGAEIPVVPDNLDILSRCDRVAIELHYGAGQILDPLMQGAGFTFRRVSRRDYLVATLAFSLRHPLQARKIYHAAQKAQNFQGVLKFVRGLDIVNSSNLILGAYIRDGRGVRPATPR